MLFYLGLWAWVNGEGRWGLLQITEIRGLNSPQIMQMGADEKKDNQELSETCCQNMASNF